MVGRDHLEGIDDPDGDLVANTEMGIQPMDPALRRRINTIGTSHVDRDTFSLASLEPSRPPSSQR